MFFSPYLIRRAASLLLMLGLFVISDGAASAQLYETKAKQALLLDADTGTILFAKEENTPIPPASLAKLMTAEVVFNALKTGALSLDDKFVVSEKAWREGGANSGGSTMFAKLGSEIEVESLLRGIIIQSANDGCMIIAEGMAGSEAAFAGLMNERAKKIGLKESVFTNSTGLPDPNQKVTLRDLSILARHLIETYPEYYGYYSEPDFEWNKIKQRNRNPILAMEGADGLKTGFTEESGYAIVASAIGENGQRLIGIMSGMTSKRQRAEEARKLLSWGFRAFDKSVLFDAGEVIGQANVYGGETGKVDVVGKGPVEILLPVGNRDRLKARIVYQGPLMPPVAEGDQIATLKIWIGDTLSQETPLYAGRNEAKGGLQRQAVDALQELLLGWL